MMQTRTCLRPAIGSAKPTNCSRCCVSLNVYQDAAAVMVRYYVREATCMSCSHQCIQGLHAAFGRESGVECDGGQLAREFSEKLHLLLRSKDHPDSFLKTADTVTLRRLESGNGRRTCALRVPNAAGNKKGQTLPRLLLLRPSIHLQCR